MIKKINPYVFSENSAHSILIENYLQNFKNKSTGYALPGVHSLGSYAFQVGLHKDISKYTYVAIPIKNQEKIIFEVLDSLSKNSNLPISIGILLDNCTDGTKAEVLRFIDNLQYVASSILRIDLVYSEGELFESTCENLLFEFCDGKYFMSLQADIFLNDATFMLRSIRAFEQEPKLFGVSGRARVAFAQQPIAAHSRVFRILNRMFLLVPGDSPKSRFLGNPRDRQGYFGDTSEYPRTRMKFTRNQFLTIYPGQSIIRGPLVWRSSIFRKLGGFNDLAFYLGRDDCDLCLRAQLSENMFVAYLPSTSYSFPESGTTRKPRSNKVLEELASRDSLMRAHPGLLNTYWEDKTGFRSSVIKYPKKIRLKTEKIV